MTNKQLPISELKNILSFEIEKINNNDIKEKYNKIIDEMVDENNIRKGEFIFRFIKSLIEKYEGDIQLNIFIDQYSSKYDQNNKNINELINIIKVKNLKCKLFIISSMNNTCVSSNLSKTFREENNFIVVRFYIKYNYYGALFNDNIISQNETYDVKKIMKEFGNSSLIYYQLKSEMIKNNNVQKDIFFNQFLVKVCNLIKEEIKIFYHIIDENKK